MTKIAYQISVPQKSERPQSDEPIGPCFNQALHLFDLAQVPGITYTFLAVVLITEFGIKVLGKCMLIKKKKTLRIKNLESDCLELTDFVFIII